MLAARRSHPGGNLTPQLARHALPRVLVALAAIAALELPHPDSGAASQPAYLSPTARGRAMLSRAATWAGGSAAFARVRTWREQTVSTLLAADETARIETSAAWRYPDRMRLVQKLPVGEVVQGFDGADGWGRGMEGVRDAPEVGEVVREEFERSIFRLFARPDTLRIEAEVGLRTLEEVPLQVARVTSALVRDWRLYFAPDGRLAGMSYRDLGPSGEAEVLTLFDDWRGAGAGVRYPFASRTWMNGVLHTDTEVKSALANPALPNSLFRRPEN